MLAAIRRRLHVKTNDAVFTLYSRIDLCRLMTKRKPSYTDETSILVRRGMATLFPDHFQKTNSRVLQQHEISFFTKATT